jgi:hypothetical protein
MNATGEDISAGVLVAAHPARRVPSTLRPYLFQLVFAIYLPALLIADRFAGDERSQALLGVATFMFLFLASRASPARERRLVWLAVGFWTAVEIVGSRVWGIYGYRMENLPLFVPAGHGLIYLFGLRCARTPFGLKHGAMFARITVMIAGGWALAGLTILPFWTGRLDLAGALLFPIFAWGIRRSRRATFYAAVFVATSALEILGTALGTWTWAESQPLTGISQGNPPSVIAGAYCIWDATLRRISPRLHAAAVDGEAR